MRARDLEPLNDLMVFEDDRAAINRLNDLLTILQEHEAAHESLDNDVAELKG